MLQNSRSAKPKHIKLDKLPGLPTLRALEDMRQKAMANSSLIELPFGDDTQTLILTVSREISKGSWLWTLYRNDEFHSGVEWSHLTHDANYIHTLIQNSSPGFMVSTVRPSTQESQAYTSQESSIKIRKGSLEGNLKNIQAANLLQSVQLGQMTGRLEIVSAADTARIYFTGGKPVHATVRGADGHEALIQLFAWDEGEFSFYEEKVDQPNTVTRGLTGLMMEGATFVDHYVYLRDRGLRNESYPVRLKNFDSEGELAEAVKDGLGGDIGLLSRIYVVINGNRSWGEIIRDLSVKKTEWMHAMFDLVSCGVVQFDAKSASESQLAPAPVSNIDWSITQGIAHSLSRPDTGLFTHAALLYNLQQEFFRYEDMDLPFSIILFCYCEKTDGPSDGSPPRFVPFRAKAIIELRDKVAHVRKRYDMLCHYGAFGYAMLLPLSIKDNATRFAEMLAEICAGIFVSDQYEPGSIEFRAGVASIPDDCRTLEQMFALAEKIHPLSG